MYEGIHHVSLLVSDLERSKHFYSEVLGFKENKNRPAFDFPGAWYEVGNTQIHLIVYEDGKTLRGSHKIDSRDGHFAIRVQDMESFIDRMKKHHVEPLNKPNNKTNWHQAFICDPDGNIIEFNQ